MLELKDKAGKRTVSSARHKSLEKGDFEMTEKELDREGNIYMKKVEYSEEKARNQDVKTAKQQKQHKIELSLRKGS